MRENEVTQATAQLGIREAGRSLTSP